MRAFLLALCFSVAHSPLCFGSPAYSGSQVILGSDDRFQNPFTNEAVQDSATEFLSNAKKAILNGKANMQKWVHDGKKFIKQNGLLCKCLLLYTMDCTDLHFFR